MSSILVLEQEPDYMERISGALGAEGWRVRIVQEPSQALQVAASDAPDLVIVSAAVAGAAAVAIAFARSTGGPGVLGLLPTAAEAPGFTADEVLAKPFTDQDLRATVRRAVEARRAAVVAAPRPARGEVRLTSHDIFGDVLAEVEGAPQEASAGAAPRRPAASAPRPAAASPAGAEDLDRRLEETLSGVFGADLRPRPARPPIPAPPQPTPTTPRKPEAPPQAAASRKPEAEDDDLDAILSKTLSSLDLGSRPKPAAPRPSPPSPAAEEKPAVPPPAPRPMESGVRPIGAGLVGEGTGVRRAPKVDLAALEELAHPRRPAPSAVSPLTPAPPAPAPGPKAAPPAAASIPKAPVPPAAASAATVRTELPTQPIPPAPVAAPAPPRPAPAPAASVAAAPAVTQRIPVMPVTPLAPGTVPDETGDEPGERFGQYTLLEKIAVGGMAELWKARMRGVEGFQKTVAIKKILPHMTDNSEFIGMFIDEAKLAAQLSHPNIVHIYDLGKIGRDYYIAMEYVDGKDLRSILNAGRRRGLALPLGLSLLIAARVASALDYAHRKRDFEGRELALVHRDVSPQNVLISYEGDVKLCDFGIAKAVSKAGQTQMGALKGKLQYMSPEQAWGRAVDARSDIFSLGAVLFEMLTGERLFTGDSEMSVLESVRQGRTRSPREVDPTIPAEVDELVSRALAHDAQNRFQSAGELKQRIEGVLHGITPSPGPTDLAAYLHRILEPEPAVDPESAHFLIEPAAPTATPAAAAVPLDPESEVVAAVAPVGEVRVEESGPRSRGLLYAAIAALVVVVILTFVLLNRRSAAAPPAQPQAAAPAPGANPAGTPAAPRPGGAVPAASSAAKPAGVPVDVSKLVEQELAKREQEERKKKEEQLKQLEKQVAQKNGKAGAPTPVPAASTADARPAAAPTASAPAPVPLPAAASTPEPAPVKPEPEPPKPQEKAAPPVPAPAPETPRVHTGDLVPGGPGVSPPELVSNPRPEYPPQARRLQVQGVVVVSVLVDENGRVQDARLLEPIKQDVGINEAALRVARGAQYRPATKDGVRVKMWTKMRIPFKL